MKTIESVAEIIPMDKEAWPDYRRLSLLELVMRIVYFSDKHALKELHDNRFIFRFGNGPLLRLAEYVDKLCNRTYKRWETWRNPFELRDQAYNQTIDRFSNMPPDNYIEISKEEKFSGRRLKQKGADCRYYFMAFLCRALKDFEANPPRSKIEQEARTATILTKHVERQFYKYCCKDAERNSNLLVSRYFWRRRGCFVWLPSSMSGNEKRRWLDENIKNPEMMDRETIQNIINDLLPMATLLSLDKPGIESTYYVEREQALPATLTKERISNELPVVVAEHKIDNIEHQRPAIRELGKELLKRLILVIFEELSFGEYNSAEVARIFGLNKATFSRFAGSRWILDGGIVRKIPDLWRNLSKVLASHPEFVEAAQEAGVWKHVERTLTI